MKQLSSIDFGCDTKKSSHYLRCCHSLLIQGRSVRLLLFLLLFLSCILGNPLFVWAQDDDQNQPQFNVTDINTANFPDIKVTLYGENLGTSLSDLPVTLLEDQEQQSIQARGIEEVGIQVAFVLDASNNIRDTPGNSGRPGYEEYRLAVETLVDNRNILSSETDWTAAYTTGSAADRFRPISTWTQDHGVLRNELLQYVPDQDTPRTSLFELVAYVLDRFEDDSAVPTNLMKTIVLFSDGFDATSDLDINDGIRRAQEMKIRIDTVMLGAESPQRRDNLERIAKLTGGTYTLLTDPVNDLDGVWNGLERQRRQLALTYRLAKAQPRELEVRAQLPGRSPIIEVIPYPLVPIKPVGIQVSQPASELNITRTRLDPAAPLIEVEPNFLAIQLDFAWPDGRPRTFQRIEYSINDDTNVQETEPFGEFAFPIGNLTSGRYTLRVRAIDEFGLTSEPAPVSLAIQVIEPTPAPTATAMATSTPMPTPTPSPTTVIIPALPQAAGAPALESEPEAPPQRNTLLLLFLILLLLMLFLLYRRWHRRRDDGDDDSEGLYTLSSMDDCSGQPSQSFQSTDELTEVPAASPFAPEPAAHLVAVNPQYHLPQRITLYSGSAMRIGRKPELNDVILDDKQVSRVHAIITHKNNGDFYIQDNGSTGGTYVNRQKLTASDDRALYPNDIINFYAIAYRFEPVNNDEQTEIPVGDYFAQNLLPPESESIKPPSQEPLREQPAKEDQTDYMLHEDDEPTIPSEQIGSDRTEKE